MPGPRRPIISQIGGQVVRFHESDANMATSLNSNALVGNAQKHLKVRSLRAKAKIAGANFLRLWAEIPTTEGPNSEDRGPKFCAQGPTFMHTSCIWGWGVNVKMGSHMYLIASVNRTNINGRSPRSARTLYYSSSPMRILGGGGIVTY